MKIKVDTKEKFKVWRLQETHFSVKMAEELTSNVIHGFQELTKSAIIDFTAVLTTEKQALVDLATLHQLCFKNKASMVIFGVSAALQRDLVDLGLSEVLNQAPTESEAWDIVQMEEIERELFGDE